MEKSYVGIEQKVCPVCGQVFDTGAVLMDKRLKDTLNQHQITGYGFCEEHEAQRKNGFIALIETKNQPEGDRMQPEDADRTGQICHIKKSVFRKLFDVSPPKKGIAFVEVGVIETIKGMISDKGGV